MITKSLPSSVVQLGWYRESGCFRPTDYPDAEALWLKILPKSNIYASSRTLSPSTITYQNSYGKRMNYCSHVKDTITAVPANTHFYAVKSYSSRWCNAGYRHWQLGKNHVGFNFTNAVPGVLPIYEVTSTDRKTAWAELQPQLNDGFSLLNFLWELREIKQLFSLYGSIKQLVNRGGAWSKTGSASEVLLGWSFGIAPTWSDIQQLIELGLNVQKKLNDFIDKGRKILPYHYRRLISKTVSEIPTYCGILRKGTEVWYMATMWASYVYQKISELDAFARIWGLRLTPAAVWQALPWSFVVDWVFKIGNFLEALDKDPNMRLTLQGYCDTVKCVSYAESIVSGSKRQVEPTYGDGIFYDSLHDGSTIWRWERSSYLRTPGLPDTGFAFPVSDSLSARELVLGGALLRAQI